MDKQTENINNGKAIAGMYDIIIPDGYMNRAIKYREMLKSRIENGIPGRWARKKYRKGYKTYCGQFTSEFFVDIKCDMTPFLKNRKPKDINTTMQWTNAKKYNALQVDMEEAFYLACVGILGLVLSPYHLEIGGIHYNHAAVIWPMFTQPYNPETGPYIAQEGWYHFYGEPISDPRAWGEVWKNRMVKCFIPLQD